MKPMFKLLASNKAKGSFKIEAKQDADEATIYLYDMIVSTDDEAEWWGGVSPHAFAKALNDLSFPRREQALTGGPRAAPRRGRADLETSSTAARPAPERPEP
jgi:hypothetical protein